MSDNRSAVLADEQVIRQHLGSLAAGDVASALSDYAPDGVIHYPGDNRLSGDHVGHHQLGAFFRAAMELTSGSFQPTPISVMAGDGHVAIFVRCAATRDGKAYEWLAADVYRIEGGHIAEHWIFEQDQALVDELFR